MDAIQVSADLAAKLAGLHTQVELLDPKGNKIGQFVPVVDLTGWEPVTPDITDEERKQRKASNEPRYSTEEVLAHLEAVHVSRRMDAKGS